MVQVGVGGQGGEDKREGGGQEGMVRGNVLVRERKCGQVVPMKPCSEGGAVCKLTLLGFSTDSKNQVRRTAAESYCSVHHN